MKLLRIGCGCIVLVTQESDQLPKSTIRLIDYCGVSGDEASLRIGRESLLKDHANPENLKQDNVVELSAEESAGLFDRLANLVSDGYRFQELQRLLKSAVRD